MVFAFKIGFLVITWVDFIDVGLVSILLYQIYKLLRGSIAGNLFLGLLALYLVYRMGNAAPMEWLGASLWQVMGVGFSAMIVLFQPEIRKFLLVLGRSTEFRENFLKTVSRWRHGHVDDFDVSQVLDAVKSLQATRTGALIVFTRDSELKFYAQTGDSID